MAGSRAFIAGALSLCLSAAAALPTAAQRVEGRVVLEGWGEAVAGAVVYLMDGGLGVVDSVAANRNGAFQVALPGAGPYSLQARSGPWFSSISDPITGDSIPASVILEFPSTLYREARACAALAAADTAGRSGAGAGAGAGPGVLAGVVYDPISDVPLNGATVTVAWTAADGSRATRHATASEAGRYVVCGVPSSVPVWVMAELMGKGVSIDAEVVVEPMALARHDIALDPRDRGAPLRVVRREVTARTGPGAAAGGAILAGQVLDAATGRPVEGVRVAAAGGVETATSAEGWFRLARLPPGELTLELEHIGYGRHAIAAPIPADSQVTLELALAPEIIDVGSVTGRASRRPVPMEIAGARSSRTLAGERLEELTRAGAPVYQALIGMPGLRIGYAPSTEGAPISACVESTRSRNFGRGCYPVEVFLDGVAVAPEFGLALLLGPPRDYQRIEYLAPGEAIRWGFRANEAGAVFLWTK